MLILLSITFIIISFILYKLIRNKNSGIIPRNIFLSLWLSFIINILLFFILYKYNNYNTNFLFMYKNYDKIELIEYYKIDNDVTYNFFIYYDNEKYLGNLSIDSIGKPYKEKANYTFSIKDIDANYKYSIFSDENLKKGLKIKKLFIDSNFSKEYIENFRN